MQALEKAGAWIATHPEIILLFVALFTVASVHYSQEIEMNVGTTAFVDETSKLYRSTITSIWNASGIDSIAVVIEADDVASPSVLKAMDRVSSHMIPDSQEEIDGILAQVDPAQLQAITGQKACRPGCGRAIASAGLPD